ncbi:cardiolipin synthase [Clostridium cibarium]|uniref:Cardiolipin synthase n=1 Tax=Clostridium cibarium TaxID=2762247 RepID=A0ABR8PQ08_9CLOT|nr:cardiolipin synthase [Clostridium cibarium]MBD7910263.1 cardiolipin synthase [Clostridium cibarium]
MFLIFLIGALLIINVAFCLSLIFIERKDPTTTWAWLLIMIILPGLGFIIYILLGQNLSREKLFKEKTFNDAVKRRELSKSILEDGQRHHVASEYLDLIRMNYNHCGAKYTTGNSVDIYYDGEDKFRELIKDLKKAQRFIHIQYYIFRRDSIGKKIINILEQKAAQGVEVRFLVDSMGSYTLTKNLMKKLTENGGKFEIFFPGVLPHINTRINYRNHRKIVVIDGEYGYIGGFNVGKEYINEDRKIGFWRDTHIRIKGEAVNELTDRFLLDWCYASGENIDNFENFYPEKTYNDGDIGIQVVTSGPDHEEQYIKHGYLKMINNAKKSIFLETPYFVPDEPVLEALKLSALSGVDVRIIIPANPDHIFMKWAANSYIGELLDLGVKVYEYENGFIHAKTIVVDGQVSTVGTANMDIRSFKLNFEVNAFIYDDRIARNLERQFFIDIENSKVITKENHDGRSRRTRIKESLVRLLSPIL